MKPNDQAVLDAALRNDFVSFLHACVKTLNPGAPFRPNWHIEAIARKLDLVRAGK
jgi:hypothetical protein